MKGELGLCCEDWMVSNSITTAWCLVPGAQWYVVPAGAWYLWLGQERGQEEAFVCGMS